MKKFVKGIFFILPVLFLFSCSVQEILKTAGVSKPIVKYERVKISGLSFDGIDLMFDFSINNPNALGVSLAGFDYDVEINGNSFISGEQDKKITIPSKGKDIIQIPVSLSFSELIGTYKSFADRDSVDYGLAGSFAFDLPVIGKVSVPYSASGNFPLLKIPSISVEELKLKDISLLGAEVVLKLNCENRNNFDLGIDGFNYSFGIAGNEWINSGFSKKLSLKSGKESEITIPIKLNFLQVGSSVYNLLTGNSELDYFLKGDFNVTSGLPLLGRQIINLNKNGKINLLK